MSCIRSMASSPSTMAWASWTSSSPVSSDTLPISRKYMRTGSPPTSGPSARSFNGPPWSLPSPFQGALRSWSWAPHCHHRPACQCPGQERGCAGGPPPRHPERAGLALASVCLCSSWGSRQQILSHMQAQFASSYPATTGTRTRESSCWRRPESERSIHRQLQPPFPHGYLHRQSAIVSDCFSVSRGFRVLLQVVELPIAPYQVAQTKLCDSIQDLVSQKIVRRRRLTLFDLDQGINAFLEPRVQRIVERALHLG